MPFAVFLDILGSSHYFTTLPDDYDFADEAADCVGYHYARLEFHDAIRIATAIATQGLVFRASFSDCAYLIYDDPKGILLATAIAMRHFYHRVPVRGGIGYGNFGMGRTVHESDGKSSSTEASLFGSALVRAFEAEHCGLKGMRVFVHSGAAPQLAATHKGITVYSELDYAEIEEGERPQTLGGTVIELQGESAPNVRHELCFIGHEGIDRYLRGLEKLKLAFPLGESDSAHYDQTRIALHRFQSLRAL